MSILIECVVFGSHNFFYHTDWKPLAFNWTGCTLVFKNYKYGGGGGPYIAVKNTQSICKWNAIQEQSSQGENPVGTFWILLRNCFSPAVFVLLFVHNWYIYIYIYIYTHVDHYS